MKKCKKICKKICKIWKRIGIFLGICLVIIVGCIYYLIKGINWLYKKIFKKEIDLIPIDKWLDEKYFSIEDSYCR